MIDVGRVPLRDIASVIRVLEFYADQATYEESSVPHPNKFATGIVPIDEDCGQRARDVLADLALIEGRA